MGMNLTQYRAALRLDLKDSGSLWSNAELDRSVERAVDDFSRFYPLEDAYTHTIDFEVTDEDLTIGEAADVDQVVAAADISATVAGNTLTITASPDIPRVLVLTITDANSSITEFTITVEGVDQNSVAVEETFMFGGGLTQTGQKVFKTVTRVLVESITGNGAGDVLNLGVGAITNVWHFLTYKPVKPESEVLTNTAGTTTYVRGTDYIMDYVNGAVKVMGATLVAGTACHIDYTKSKLGFGLKDIIPDFMSLQRIVRVEYPDDSIPQQFVSFNIWNNFLHVVSKGNTKSQESLTDGERIVFYFERKHRYPTIGYSGSIADALDEIVSLGAGAYSMFIKSAQMEHQAVTDFASARTLVGTTISHTKTGTALDATNTALDLINALYTKVATSLDAIATTLGATSTMYTDAETALAAANTSTDLMAAMHTKIATALDAIATQLGNTSTMYTAAETALDAANTTLDTIAALHSAIATALTAITTALGNTTTSFTDAETALDAATTAIGALSTIFTAAETAMDAAKTILGAAAMGTQFTAVGTALTAASTAFAAGTTALGSTGALHTLAQAALALADTQLDSAILAGAFTEVETALDAMVTQTGTIMAFLTGGTAPSTNKYLGDGDAYINTVNVGDNVGELFATYAGKCNELAMAIKQVVDAYESEAQARLSKLDRWRVAADSWIAQANSYVGEITAYLNQATDDVSIGNGYVGVAGTTNALIETYIAQANGYLSEATARLNETSQKAGQASMYLQEAQARLGKVDRYIQTASGYATETQIRVTQITAKVEEANGYVNEAAARLSEIDRKVATATGYATEANTRIAQVEAKAVESNAYISEAQARLSEIDRKTAVANGYANEAQARLADVQARVNEAAGYDAEAQSRLAEIDRYLGEADRYINSAAYNLQLADRFRTEAIERRNEFWSILKDKAEYRRKVSSVALQQPG